MNSEPVITMEYSCVVVTVLALIASASASIGDNTIDGGERVLLVAPVLAPPKESRTHATDRSRQYPILVLLAPRYPIENVRLEPEAKSLKEHSGPIYVKKLEDQENGQHNREKRHLHSKKSFLGSGGYGGHGGGGGGGNYGHGGCGGGCGGGYGYNGAPAAASAIAIAQASSYGKR